METAIAPSLTELPDAKLKDLFDRSFELCHIDIDTSSWFDPDIAEEDVLQLPEPDLPSDYEVAQVMMERRLSYWEHMGWLKACKTAIHQMVCAEKFDDVQAICQWLLEAPPKGMELLNKELVEYAAGEFPVEAIAERNERTDALVNRIKANRSGGYEPNPIPIWKRLETELA